MSEEKIDVARRLIELFNRIGASTGDSTLIASPDREAIKEITTDDLEIVPLRAALEGTVFRGPNALDDFWAASRESWETLRMDIDEVSEHGDRVLAVGRLRGRSRETGMEVEAPMGWVATFANGKIASIRTYPSVAEAREAAEVGGQP